MKNITTYIAIYGALLSSIGIIWNIYRDFRDRGKAKFFAFIGNSMNPDTDGYERYLIYHITNAGRRPLVITKIGGIRKRGDNFLFRPRSLPMTLKEGDCHMEYTHDLSVLDKNLKYLSVYDSLDKCYKFKGRKLKKLIEEIIRKK